MCTLYELLALNEYYIGRQKIMTADYCLTDGRNTKIKDTRL